MSSFNIENVFSGLSSHPAVKAWFARSEGIEDAFYRHIKVLPLLVGDVLDEPLTLRSLQMLWEYWFKYCALSDLSRDLAACLAADDGPRRVSILRVMLDDFHRSAVTLKCAAALEGAPADEANAAFHRFVCVVLKPLSVHLFINGQLTVGSFIEENPTCLLPNRLLEEIHAGFQPEQRLASKPAQC